MAVSKEDMMDELFRCEEFSVEKASYRVNDADMDAFKGQDKKLAKKIGSIKLKYEEDNKISSMAAYDQLEEKCQISVSTLKSTISGKIPPTRNFLYKFTVGLKMKLEEANELFQLCDGPLTLACKADKICIFALRDHDDIYQFIDDMQKYTRIKIELRDRKASKKR